MRVGFLSLASIISVFVVAASTGFGHRAVVAQITFVQAPQNRDQTQNQQQGLPPEKKKSLARYGPEDVFPGANEREDSRRQNSRPRQRSQTASVSRPAPTPRQSSTPAPTPVATPSPEPTQSVTAESGLMMAAEPRPTIMAPLGNQFQQSPPARQFSSTQTISPWTVPVLSGLALIVSVALIYVLIKLREKIREGSGA